MGVPAVFVTPVLRETPLLLYHDLQTKKGRGEERRGGAEDRMMEPNNGNEEQVEKKMEEERARRKGNVGAYVG